MATFERTHDGIGAYRLATGDKRYRVVYRVNGRTKSKGGFARKEDARRWRDKNRVAVDQDQHVDRAKGRTPFAEYAEGWIATADLRPTTIHLYGYLLRCHIEPTFGTTPLASINESAVRSWLAHLRTKPANTATGNLSRSTVAKAYRLLSRILGTAVDDRYLVVNPCRVKKAGKEDSPPQRCPTAEEVWALAEAVPEEYRALVLVAGFGGLRWGEAIALRRSHVDLANGCVHVRQQVNEIGNSRVVVSDILKTTAGRRDVYLPPAVTAAIAQVVSRRGTSGDPLLFPPSQHGDGDRYLRRANWRRRVWLPALGDVGCEAYRFHDLRHAAATLAAQAGYTTRELMTHIGHASPEAALRYQHAASSRMASLADRLGDVVGVPQATGTDNVVPIRP